jgi:hypothetical protein
MSQVQPPKKVLSRNIDESTAPNHDLLLTYASSIPTDRLQTLEDWLRSGSPTGSYIGTEPTYRLRFDWTSNDSPVEVVNRAMELCFGLKGAGGWEIWIRGDQLNLLVGDFRKEYLRLKAMGDPEVMLLDVWVNGLLNELKRM